MSYLVPAPDETPKIILFISHEDEEEMMKGAWGSPKRRRVDCGRRRRDKAGLAAGSLFRSRRTGARYVVLEESIRWWRQLCAPSRSSPRSWARKLQGLHRQGDHDDGGRRVPAGGDHREGVRRRDQDLPVRARRPLLLQGGRRDLRARQGPPDHRRAGRPIFRAT